jgi:RNA-splicing ligase RtcB
MTPRMVRPKLLSWASEVDDNTLDQAERTARLPFVAGHVALMPDAHYGLGSTVGSVIPTEGAVIPSAIGVDIGCGMIAVRTDLMAGQLPDTLGPVMPLFEERIPAGVGQAHDHAVTLHAIGEPASELTDKQWKTAATQFGTLGSGNHFVEVCLDESDRVWLVLHSGSRGIGNQLAQKAVAQAKGLVQERMEALEDPDLAYLVEGESAWQSYITDMLWAQRYALGSRERMMDAAVKSLVEVVGHGREVQRINCHHNFTQRETHGGRELWITRKGAIKAAKGDLGVIPGSMGTRSYIVEGLGSEASYDSCAHGAGRRLSRTKARKTLTVDSLKESMAGRVWNDRSARALLDEHPASYKDIDRVMADQTDLVSVTATLRQIVNYKGTS